MEWLPRHWLAYSPAPHMVSIRKIDASELADTDLWARWREPRATYAVVTGETDGGASVLTFPDLDGAEMLITWSMLPLSVLPLSVGDVLPLTMQRLAGQFDGWKMRWCHSKAPTTPNERRAEL